MLLRSPVTRLGPYTLHGQLAAGGMASVHLATHEDDAATVVALKLVHDHLDEDEFLKRFIQEARICQRIEHPNVCRVVDLGEHEGLHYLVMEFLHGGTLAALLRALGKNGGWDEAELPVYLSFLIDVLDGLHAAHELVGDDGEHLDVVHRDLSPSNVFVTFDGQTKVLDFGIAKARNALHKSVTGELRGTIAYMSPEQASALPVDRRADVWSVGVILWELLTMRRLFRRGNDVATLKAVLQEQPQPPSKSNPRCPPVFDEVCLSALKRSVGQRPSTAARFAEELRKGVELMGWTLPSRAQRSELVRSMLATELEKSEAKLEQVAADHPDMSEWVSTTLTGSLPDPSTSEPTSTETELEPSEPAAERFTQPPFEVPVRQSKSIRLRVFGAVLVGGLVLAVANRYASEANVVEQPIALPGAGPLHPEAYGSRERLPPPPRLDSVATPTPDPASPDPGSPPSRARVSKNDSKRRTSGQIQRAAPHGPESASDVVRRCRFRQPCIIENLRGREDSALTLGLLADAYLATGDLAAHRRTVVRLQRLYPNSSVARKYR